MSAVGKIHNSIHFVQRITQYLKFTTDVVGEFLQLHFRVQHLYVLRVRVVPDSEFFRYRFREFAKNRNKKWSYNLVFYVYCQVFDLRLKQIYV